MCCLSQQKLFDLTQSVFPAERLCCLHTSRVFVSRYSEITGFMLQPAHALPHSFLRSESSSSSCQSVLYLGTESPFCVNSTSLLPQLDSCPRGFHRWEVFLGVGWWLGKKTQTEISIWICKVGCVSCEHPQRRSRCFRGPHDRVINKSTGTNSSIHHSILRSPPHIITTLNTNHLPLFCVFFPIFTGWASVHDLISMLHSKLTSCLLGWEFIFLAPLLLSLPMWNRLIPLRIIDSFQIWSQLALKLSSPVGFPLRKIDKRWSDAEGFKQVIPRFQKEQVKVIKTIVHVFLLKDVSLNSNWFPALQERNIWTQRNFCFHDLSYI